MIFESFSPEIQKQKKNRGKGCFTESMLRAHNLLMNGTSGKLLHANFWGKQCKLKQCKSGNQGESPHKRT